jgi:type IX secretion system PorP/SprF family membrane protein
MKKSIIVSVFLMMFIGQVPNLHAQDPLFTQYFSEPLYYNPALTGANEGLRARFNYRDQWTNLPTSYRAYYFSADLGDRQLPGAGGLGIMINSDNEGTGFIHNFEAALTIGVRIPLAKLMVAQLGIKASVKQKTINWDDYFLTDQLSEKYGLIYQSAFTHPDANKRVYPDFGAGMIVQFSTETGNITGTAGIAFDHLFQPDESFLATASSPLPRKFIGQFDMVISAGSQGSSSMANWGSGSGLLINPGILYINQSQFNTIEAGVNLQKFNFYLGSWFKSTLTGAPSNSLAVLAGYNFPLSEEMAIKFMYSYDIPISGAMLNTGGAHEVSLVLEFRNISLFGGGGSTRTRNGYEPIECPFFY